MLKRSRDGSLINSRDIDDNRSYCHDNYKVLSWIQQHAPYLLKDGIYVDIIWKNGDVVSVTNVNQNMSTQNQRVCVECKQYLPDPYIIHKTGDFHPTCYQKYHDRFCLEQREKRGRDEKKRRDGITENK